MTPIHKWPTGHVQCDLQTVFSLSLSFLPTSFYSHMSLLSILWLCFVLFCITCQLTYFFWRDPPSSPCLNLPLCLVVRPVSCHFVFLRVLTAGCFVFSSAVFCLYVEGLSSSAPLIYHVTHLPNPMNTLFLTCSPSWQVDLAECSFSFETHCSFWFWTYTTIIFFGSCFQCSLNAGIPWLLPIVSSSLFTFILWELSSMPRDLIITVCLWMSYL